MAKEKKKLSPLRRAFNYAGAVFLGVYFAGPQISAMQATEAGDIARRLGLDVQTMTGLTKPRTYFLYPEKDSSSLFARLTFSPKVIETTSTQRQLAESASPFYDFYGFAYRDTAFGPGGYLDKGTFGITGKAAPCYVFFPSEKLTLDEIREALSGIPAGQLRPLPGTLQEYLQLILYHETEHCNQTVGTDPSQNEVDADRRSFDVFLEKGGDPEIVRSVLNMRAVSAMTMLIFYENDKEMTPPHGQIANLYSRYFSGTELNPEDHERALTETLALLKKQARSQRLDSLDLLDHKTLYAVAAKVLDRSDLAVTAGARTLLTRYVAAYEFTVKPPEPRKPAQNPALAL